MNKLKVYYKKYKLTANVIAISILLITTILFVIPNHQYSKNYNVITGENTWGNIVQQLLHGTTITNKALITSNSIDPHEYEPQPGDKILIKNSNLIIANGCNYDNWVTNIYKSYKHSNKLVDVCTDILGIRDINSNPHIWYNPLNVIKVITYLHNLLIDQYHNKTTIDQNYNKLIIDYKQVTSIGDSIIEKKSNKKIGASESIIIPLNDYLHLNIDTPSTFLDSVEKEIDPSEKDIRYIQDSIQNIKISAFIYNTQSTNKIVDQLVKLCKQFNIPIISITETLPNKLTMQEWQKDILNQLLNVIN